MSKKDERFYVEFYRKTAPADLAEVTCNETEADAYMVRVIFGHGIRIGPIAYKPGYWDTASKFTSEEWAEYRKRRAGGQ